MPEIPHSDTLIHRASCLAARLHQNQYRKDGVTPYLSHLLRVSLVLSSKFSCTDPVTIAAGILHDAIEDTTADYDEIAEAVGHEVAELVAALTKDMRIPESEREAAYDRQLGEAPWQARLIKLADVYDNLCDSVLSGAQVSVRAKAERALALAKDEPELSQAATVLRKLLD